MLWAFPENWKFEKYKWHEDINTYLYIYKTIHNIYDRYVHTHTHTHKLFMHSTHSQAEITKKGKNL